MKTLSLAGLVFVLSSGAGMAQTAPTPPFTALLPKTDEKTAPATTTASTAATNPSAPKAAARPTGNTVSPEIASKIAATAPKFSPPKETSATKEEDLPDLRDIDKPRNGIIRLPKVTVQEPKAPVFKERELLTPKGKIALGYKNHPGLRINLPFLGSNDRIAAFMVEEELRLERMSEAGELAGLYRYTDPKSAATAQRANDVIFLRHPEPYTPNRGSAGP